MTSREDLLAAVEGAVSAILPGRPVSPISSEPKGGIMDDSQRINQLEQKVERLEQRLNQLVRFLKRSDDEDVQYAARKAR